MNINDILTLAKMGFNKDEILSLVSINPETPKTAPEAPKTPTEPETPKTPTNTPADTLKPVLERLEALEQRIKLNNIIGTSITPPKQTPAETAEDILAKIINPNT